MGETSSPWVLKGRGPEEVDRAGVLGPVQCDGRVDRAVVW